MTSRLEPGRAAGYWLPLLAVLLAPSLASAQASRGVPMLPDETAYVRGSFDMNIDVDASAWTGDAGVRLGETHVVSVGFSRGRVNQNGSHSYTYSLRYAAEIVGEKDGEGYSGCVVLGLSRGYAWLWNAEGLRANAQVSTVHFPLAVGVARGFVLAEGVRVTPYVLPQLAIVYRSLKLYDRSQVLFDDGENDGYLAGALGVSVTFRNLFIGTELYSKLDGDAAALTFSVGGSL